MKTIDDIVCDMLRVADSAEKKHIYDLRELGSDSLRAYANLIKEAHKKELADAVAAKCEVCDQVAVAKSATTTATCQDSRQVQSVTDCNGLGDTAKMREALEAVVKVGYPHNFQREAPHIRGYCYEITTAIEKCFAVLSAPARNCDKYSHDEALRIWSSLPETKENGCFDVWLYAEAKGDAK